MFLRSLLLLCTLSLSTPLAPQLTTNPVRVLNSRASVTYLYHRGRERACRNFGTAVAWGGAAAAAVRQEIERNGGEAEKGIHGRCHPLPTILG